MLLTKYLNGIIYRYLFPYLCIVFAVLSIFAKPLDDLLHPLGYTGRLVSHFPFVLYSQLISINKSAHIYFHVFYITTWMSAAVWGTRLVAGTVYLKQYDALYLIVSRRLSEMPLIFRWMFYACLISMVLGIFAIASFPTQASMLRDPETNFVVSYFPGVFTFVFASMYYVWGFLLIEPALFLLWKLTRQSRADSRE